MRKIFRHALTGFVVASFSHLALAQNGNVTPKTGDANVSQGSRGSTQSQPEDKNPNSPGKGWAKGKERGKGNPHRSGASGGSQSSGTSQSNQSSAGAGSSTNQANQSLSLIHI